MNFVRHVVRAYLHVEGLTKNILLHFPRLAAGVRDDDPSFGMSAYQPALSDSPLINVAARSRRCIPVAAASALSHMLIVGVVPALSHLIVPPSQSNASWSFSNKIKGGISLILC